MRDFATLARFRPQLADTQAGSYYVSVQDAGRTGLLLGPFRLHQSALRAVDTGRKIAVALKPEAWFYAFGTCRMPSDYRKPGVLNGHIKRARPYNG